jgi:hypothetical protein
MRMSNEFLVPSFQFPALATFDWEIFVGTRNFFMIRRYANIV